MECFPYIFNQQDLGNDNVCHLVRPPRSMTMVDFILNLGLGDRALVPWKSRTSPEAVVLEATSHDTHVGIFVAESEADISKNMSNQACEPCARRKVRCDKQQPCSNCKRRKQDQCTYPEAAPTDRVKRLESLVRSLGGDPNSDGSRTPKRARLGPSPVETQSNDRDAGASTESERGQPILVEQDGQSYYVEMSVKRLHEEGWVFMLMVLGVPGIRISV